ncbi:MAG: NAD-dependent epimerase/dehydratase family protein [Saprospiraceae bacterium]|nr:NAD-dependent epimerase/dehydratase family protein [Saprospiraceae bacterium]
MQEKILIPGANGFIGGYLVDEAIKQGLDVFAGVREREQSRFIKRKKLQVIYRDFDDEASLVDLMQNYKFDYIIHNAGITKSPDKNQFHEVNVNLLVKLTKAIQKSGVTLRKFVYISSLAAWPSGSSARQNHRGRFYTETSD